MSIKIAALLLALMPTPALAQLCGEMLPQGLTVQGSATVKTAPDMATISISLRGDGITADAASTALAASQKNVIGGIRSLDPTADYRTGDVSMREVRKGNCASASEEVDLSDLASGNREPDKGPCRVVGYIASISATVEMRAIDKAGTAIGLATRLGASSADLGGFGLRDPAAAQRTATTAAIADARSRAEMLATSAGTRLGPVLSIVGGSENAMNMPAKASFAVYEPAMVADPPVVIDVAPKPVETSAQIVIVYALAR